MTLKRPGDIPTPAILVRIQTSELNMENTRTLIAILVAAATTNNTRPGSFWRKKVNSANATPVKIAPVASIAKIDVK